MEGVDSDAGGSTKTPYEVLREQLGLSTVKKTVATVKKKTTAKTATPKTRLINLVRSLDGAAKEIDVDAVPFPTPTKQETEALESLTATIISMMGKT